LNAKVSILKQDEKVENRKKRKEKKRKKSFVFPFIDLILFEMKHSIRIMKYTNRNQLQKGGHSTETNQ